MVCGEKAIESVVSGLILHRNKLVERMLGDSSVNAVQRTLVAGAYEKMRREIEKIDQRISDLLERFRDPPSNDSPAESVRRVVIVSRFGIGDGLYVDGEFVEQNAMIDVAELIDHVGHGAQITVWKYEATHVGSWPKSLSGFVLLKPTEVSP